MNVIKLVKEKVSVGRMMEGIPNGQIYIETSLHNDIVQIVANNINEPEDACILLIKAAQFILGKKAELVERLEVFKYRKGEKINE